MDLIVTDAAGDQTEIFVTRCCGATQKGCTPKKNDFAQKNDGVLFFKNAFKIQKLFENDRFGHQWTQKTPF